MLRVVAVLFVLAVVVMPLAVACPGECRGYSDCPGRAYCSDGVCVPFADVDGGIIVVPYLPSDAGTGDGGIVADDSVTTTYPIYWMKKDPRPGTNQILLPAFDSTVNVDQLDALDLATGEISNTPLLELSTLGAPGAPCDLSEFIFEPDLDDKDETWVVCRAGGAADLRIYFDESYTQPALDEPHAVDYGIPLVITGPSTDETDVPRRAWFERGGPTLAIYQIDANEDPQQEANFRSVDTVTPTFSAITQLYQIGSVANQRDTLLVVDRGSTPPTIVPLQRDVGAVVWEAHQNLGVVELPAGTHAVRFIGEIDPQGNDPDDDANVMTIEPADGQIRFWNYNAAQLLEVGDGAVVYETAEQYRPDAPDPETRILVEKTPDGTAVFYAHQGSARLWRLPINEDATENDVLRYTFSQATQLPTGIVPDGNTTAWISIPSELQLYRVTFDENN